MSFYRQNKEKLTKVAISKGLVEGKDELFSGFEFITHPRKDAILFLNKSTGPWLRICIDGPDIDRELREDQINLFGQHIDDWKKNPKKLHEYWV